VGMAATIAAAQVRACAAPPPPPTFASTPFTLGVASGDPRPDRVVLWTRLAPTPLLTGGGMPATAVSVQWEVATDASFATLVATGAAWAVPEAAHSLHIDAQGLAPNNWYWYRFTVGPWVSPVGRTRTAPAVTSSPRSLRMGVATCQHYCHGYYTAHRHLADEALDAVLFVGDYIYEATATGPRAHGTPTATTLDGYRNRYALYKSDVDLQAAHASVPWIVTWDDHEVVNNYAGDADSTGVSTPEFLARRFAGYQAWWEHQPVSMAFDDASGLSIHRAFTWGDLAHLAVLDTRQHRSEYRCGSGLGALCEAQVQPDVTMLGFEQEAWLEAELTGSAATWHVVGQQVLFTPMAPTVVGDNVVLDVWDGYPVARERMLALFERPEVTNPIVLTGDFHTAVAADIHRDGDPANPRLATELMTTSITSRMSTQPQLFQDLLRSLPVTHHANAFDHGYLVCEFTPTEVTATYRVVSTTLATTSTVSTDAVITVPAVW